MSFAPYASLGMSLVSGYSARQSAKAQQIVFDAEAKAANIVRAGRNQQVAAEANLANFMRAENNRRSMEAVGEQFNAGQMNLARLQESFTQGSVEDQIRAAEQAGAYAANVAFSGAAGSSVDVVNYTLSAQQERRDFYRNQQQGRVTYDQLQQLTGLQASAYRAIDYSLAIPSQDFGVNFARQAPKQGSWLTDVLNWSAAKPEALAAIGRNVDSWFTPPVVSKSKL